MNNNKYKIEDTAAKLAADNATNEDQCCLFNLVYKIYVAQYKTQTYMNIEYKNLQQYPDVAKNKYALSILHIEFVFV